MDKIQPAIEVVVVREVTASVGNKSVALKVGDKLTLNSWDLEPLERGGFVERVDATKVIIKPSARPVKKVTKTR